MIFQYPLFQSSEGITLLKFGLSHTCVVQVEPCWPECQFTWLLVNRKNVLVECACDI